MVANSVRNRDRGGFSCPGNEKAGIGDLSRKVGSDVITRPAQISQTAANLCLHWREDSCA